ncbi:hypothetical protein WJX73_006247 [Symbiochloris irregularis]|uniref:Uncharacterized protein n=1 Tax=Symbiochloris irregularis TaxID=706552 RepID=A0AAW1NYM2_9CHLO
MPGTWYTLEEINCLVIGEGGLGKTTFCTQMHAEFLGNEAHIEHDGSATSVEQFTTDPESLCKHLPAITTSTGDRVYNHIQDSPGHSSIDNRKHMQAMIDHIISKQALQLTIDRDFLELGIKPEGDPLIQGRMDVLYDVVFYFIPPHRFKDGDLEYITRLSKARALLASLLTLA